MSLTTTSEDQGCGLLWDVPKETVLMVGCEVDRESVFDLPGRDECRMVITKGPLTVTEHEKACFLVSLESFSILCLSQQIQE
jgi:hypothetical protein